MKDTINEMDMLFKHVVKYYDMRDKKEVKREWNSLVYEVKKLNLRFVIKRFFNEHFWVGFVVGLWIAMIIMLI